MRRTRVCNREMAKAWRKELTESFHEGFDFFEGKRILEVGCGAFGAIHYLDIASLKVGLDPLCFSFRNIIRQTPSTAHLVAGISEKLPFKNESFDVILCLNVLDHVMDPQGSLEEIARVLRAGGILFLNVDIFNLLPKVFRQVLGLLDRPHPHHFSSKEVTFLLERIGFRLAFANEAKLGINLSILRKFDAHAVKLAIATALGIRKFCTRCELIAEETR